MVQLIPSNRYDGKDRDEAEQDCAEYLADLYGPDW